MKIGVRREGVGLRDQGSVEEEKRVAEEGGEKHPRGLSLSG